VHHSESAPDGTHADSSLDIPGLLDVDGLRDELLRFTRAAWRRLPDLERPRVLELGCGRGTVTLELCRLTDGEIVAIDIDDDALGELRRRVVEVGVGGARLTIFHQSVLELGPPPRPFDLVWAEGVLHLVDLNRGLAACSRQLRSGGFLVSCETVGWHDQALHAFEAADFEVVERLPWPSQTWWTSYYRPLEERVRAVREQLGERQSAPGARDLLLRCEAEIAMVKPNPERFDCVHVVFRKR